jgi:hypothetical protein
MNTPLVVIVLITLRIAVPILLTVLFSYLAHRMNQRWQDQAARAPKEIIADELVQEAKHSAHI